MGDAFLCSWVGEHNKNQMICQRFVYYPFVLRGFPAVEGVKDPNGLHRLFRAARGWRLRRVPILGK
jgi:hypothetical protein